MSSSPESKPVAMTVTHIIQIGDVVLPSGLFKTLHVAFAIVMVCLAVLESGGRRYRTIALVAPAALLLLGRTGGDVAGRLE